MNIQNWHFYSVFPTSKASQQFVCGISIGKRLTSTEDNAFLLYSKPLQKEWMTIISSRHKSVSPNQFPALCSLPPPRMSTSTYAWDPFPLWAELCFPDPGIRPPYSWWHAPSRKAGRHSTRSTLHPRPKSPSWFCGVLFFLFCFV